MKKILSVLMVLFLGISSYNASSLDVNLDCPKTAYKGENITCEIYANTEGITGIQGVFSFEGFELVSETITQNSLFTMPNEFNKTTNKFMIGNNDGLSKSFKIGSITIKSKDNTNEGVYFIELKDVIGSSENHNDVNSMDKLSTLLLTTSDDTIKTIYGASPYVNFNSNKNASILFNDKNLFIKQANDEFVFIDSGVDEIVLEDGKGTPRYEIYYKKGKDLYFRSDEVAGPYLIYENFNGDSRLAYYVSGKDLYVNTGAVGITDRKVNSEEDCNSNELYSSEYGTCYRAYSPGSQQLKSSNIIMKIDNYFISSDKKLYELAVIDNVLDAYYAGIDDVISLKKYKNTILALKENGELYASGTNIFGSKVNAGKYLSEYTKILDNVKEYGIYYALTNNNDYYVWGISTQPKLIGSNIDYIIPNSSLIDGSYNYNSYSYKKGNKYYISKINLEAGVAEVLATSDEKIIKFAAGIGESYFITESGKLYKVDSTYNENKKLIDTDVKDILMDILTGQQDESLGTFYLKNDGKLYKICSYDDDKKFLIHKNIKSVSQFLVTDKNDIMYFEGTTNGLITDLQLDQTRIYNLFNYDSILVSGIYIIENEKITMNVNDSKELFHNIIPINSTNNKVIYSSSNPSVVRVSEDGLMTALSFGNATIRVTSLDTLVYGEIKVTVNPTDKPSTPVITTSVNGTSVTISWNEVNNGINYEIYRSTDNKTFVKLSDTSELSYVDTSVKMGYTYYYKVRSINDLGTSGYSSVKSVKVPVTSTVVSINDSNYSYVTLSWNKISGIKGYKIYRSTKSGSGYKLIKTITSYKTTSFKDASITQGKKYYYKVLVYTVINKKDVNSSYSNIVNATPKVKNLTTLKVSKDTSKSLKLTWSKVSGATSYDVYKCDASCKKVKSVTGKTYTLTGLTLGKNYKVGVRACRKGVCSEIKYVNSYVYPSKTTFTVTPNSDSITINIKKVSGANYYILKYKEKDETEYNEVKLTSLSYKMDAEIGKTYDFKLVVYKEVSEEVLLGSSEYSLSYTLKPLAAKGFMAKLTKVGSITLSWNYEEGYTYKVYRSTSKTSGYKCIKTLEDGTFVDSGLKKGTTYYYKIRVYKNGVYSDYTAIKSVKNVK